MKPVRCPYRSSSSSAGPRTRRCGRRLRDLRPARFGNAPRERAAAVAVEAERFGSSRIGPVDGIRLDPPSVDARPAPTLEDRDRVTDRLRDAAAEHGAEVEEVEVLEPYGPAFALAVRVDDPARFLVERFDPMVPRRLATGDR